MESSIILNGVAIEVDYAEAHHNKFYTLTNASMNGETFLNLYGMVNKVLMIKEL